MILLSVAVKKEDGFHIDLEDFLHGLLTLANELVSQIKIIIYSSPILSGLTFREEIKGK